MYRYDKHTDLTFPSGLHSHCEIIIVSGGELTVSVNSEPVTVKKNEGIYLPGYIIHSFKTDLHSECRIWEFDSSFIQERMPSSIKTFNFPAECITLFEESRTDENMYIKKSEIYFITSFICSDSAKAHNIKTGDIIGKTCFFIAENFKDCITLEDAAAYVGISSPYLSRTFKNSVGLSFTECLINTRVDNAMNLLKFSSTAVTEIAMLCGFGTPRNFNRFFKRVTGRTPSEYRKESKK